MFQGYFRVASMLCQEYFKGSSWKLEEFPNKVVSVVQGHLKVFCMLHGIHRRNPSKKEVLFFDKCEYRVYSFALNIF